MVRVGPFTFSDRSVLVSFSTEGVDFGKLVGYEVNELLIELEDWDSKKVYARYDAFSVGNEGEGYIMRILGNYSGTAGESLSYHGGMKFTTTDRDNDLWRDGNCAVYRSS